MKTFAGINRLRGHFATPRQPSRPTILSLVLAALTLSACASDPARQRGTEVKIRYAEVIEINRVKLPSAAPAGAMVGGFTGLVLSRRGSAGRQIAGAATGAVLGGLATKALEGERLGYSYRLAFLDGSESEFITEKGYLRQGDCVAVESGSYQNLRRVAATTCEASARVRAPVAMHQNNAEYCQQAKKELLVAQGQDAINDAARKVEIICHF